MTFSPGHLGSYPVVAWSRELIIFDRFLSRILKYKSKLDISSSLIAAMADDGDARAAEVNADSDSGEDFYGFFDQAGDSTSSNLVSSETEWLSLVLWMSDRVAVSEWVGERWRRCQRCSAWPSTRSGPWSWQRSSDTGRWWRRTPPHSSWRLSQVIWQPDDDVGVPAASNQWLPQLPNDVSYRAVQ